MSKYRLKAGVQPFTFQGAVVSGARAYPEDHPVVRTFAGRFEKEGGEWAAPAEPAPPAEEPATFKPIAEGNDFES